MAKKKNYYQNKKKKYEMISFNNQQNNDNKSSKENDSFLRDEHLLLFKPTISTNEDYEEKEDNIQEEIDDELILADINKINEENISKDEDNDFSNIEDDNEENIKEEEIINDEEDIIESQINQDDDNNNLEENHEDILEGVINEPIGLVESEIDIASEDNNVSNMEENNEEGDIIESSINQDKENNEEIEIISKDEEKIKEEDIKEDNNLEDKNVLIGTSLSEIDLDDEDIDIDEIRRLERKAQRKAQRLAKKEAKKSSKGNDDINPKTGKKRFKKRYVIIPLLLLLISGICYGLYWTNNTLMDYLSDVPELDLSKLTNYSIQSEIYDRNGDLITVYGSSDNIKWVKLEDCPQHLIDAFLSIEDTRFYEHKGFDLKRLISAVLGQITKKKSHGASTITQQLVRNIYLSREVTYKRKVQELYLAYHLEKELTKDEILEYYINRIYFGDLSYGIGAAALDYFDKDVKDLTLKEAAMIAGVTNSPNYYNPRNAKDGDITATINRTNTVLYAMHNNKKLSDEEYEKALNTDLVFAEQKEREVYPYPHFVEYAIDNVATKLLEQRGEEVNDETLYEEREFIKNAGYKIYTTIDPQMQDLVQEQVSNYNNYPIPRDPELESQVALVIIENHTGQVVTMIGSKEIPTEIGTFNRATMSKQPTGSSFKPVAVYGPALEVGNGTGSVVADKQEPIPGYNAGKGYPGGDFFDRGTTMREALEYSHNIPAVRFLVEKTGIDNAMKYLLLNGFKEEDLSPSPAGLALGASSVTVLDMTAAYHTFANDGIYIEPRGFTKVIDSTGKVILDADECTVTHRVFSEEANFMCVDMMRTNMIHGYGVNARLSTMISAGKTGTHEFEVVTFGGFTPYYTSFIRMSTDEYKPFKNSWSYTQPTRLWRAYMNPIHEELEMKSLTTKSASELEIYRTSVCKETGLSPIEGCPSAYEYFRKGTGTGGTCPGGHLEEEEIVEETP